MSGEHLVFYDGKCGLCDQAVQFLLKVDHRKTFIFAPLQGVTAKKYLQNLPEEVKKADSVVLIENYRNASPQVLIFGKAAFRIMWLLGGFWTLLGWISFLPSFLYDWGYRLVARNRHRFFRQDLCVIPSKETKDRFLD